jgi:D-alanyl-lipoteichoic acid acyltransferase DltB (MBOAT superfamily)
MLFNTYPFLFFLLFVVAVSYQLSKARKPKWLKIFLIVSSFFFYGYYEWTLVPLLITSILINFSLSLFIKSRTQQGKLFLIVGISFNLMLLGYYKYYDFFTQEILNATIFSIPPKDIILPLAISFVTFQQLGYLIDIYRRQTDKAPFTEYVLFVSFFPQLIAGPIVLYKEIAAQYKNRFDNLNTDAIASGIYLFSIGLFKKVMIADTLAVWASNGFDNPAGLNCLAAWLSTLSYTFQIYFDFSGYMDMAIGVAKMLNIDLPRNFNSPYKSLSTRDFWRRWHITLGRFLKDYLYIPLGGSRKGLPRTIVNGIIVFTLGGLWHGPAWTFVFWGLMHGIGLAAHTLWSRAEMKLPKPIAWLITFLFVTLTWVPFRAEGMDTALQIYSSLFNLSELYNIADFKKLISYISSGVISLQPSYKIPLVLTLSIFSIALPQNSYSLFMNFRPKWDRATACVILLCVSIIFLNDYTEFIYFNF